jgi:starch synthase
MRGAARPISDALRVLILSLEYGPEISGGVGTHALELARGLVAAGHSVGVVSFTKRAPRADRRDGFSLRLLSLGAEGLASTWQMSVVQSVLALNDRLLEATREEIAAGPNPDLIQCYNWVTYPAARALAQELAVPVVSTVQYISGPVEGRWGQTPDPEILEQEKILFQEADFFITVSRSMGYLLGEAYGVPPDRMRVVYNALDAEDFRAAMRPEALARLRQGTVRPGEKLVVFAGRLNPMKGITALLASASRVLSEMPGVRWVLVGEADSRQVADDVRELFGRDPALRERVVLLGKLPRRQVAMLFRIADVVVVPSIYEPFGYVAIEAMAAGAPLVATDTGGLAEIVEPGRTGLLVPVHPRTAGPWEVDVEALARAQIRLLRDPSLGRRLGEAAAERAVTRFEAAIMVEETVEAYREALAFAQEARGEVEAGVHQRVYDEI